MSFLHSSPRLVVAHRGLALDAAENTLVAFHLALEHGADVLETDVHVSADGLAVCAHDPDLQRVAGRPERVNQLSASALAAVEIPGGGVPTLSAVLEAFPTTPLSIDVKEDAAVPATVDAIAQAGAADRVLLASFSESRRQQLVRAFPTAASAATSAQIAPAFFRSLSGAQSRINRLMGEVSAVFIPPRHRGIPLATPRFIRHLSQAGVVTGVWTVNDADQMARYWRRGVQAIITDRTDRAVATRDWLAGQPPQSPALPGQDRQ